MRDVRNMNTKKRRLVRGGREAEKQISVAAGLWPSVVWRQEQRRGQEVRCRTLRPVWAAHRLFEV